MDIVYFKQTGERYIAMSKKEKNHLIGNVTQSLMFVDETVQRKIVAHFKRANRELGEKIEHELFLEVQNQVLYTDNEM